MEKENPLILIVDDSATMRLLLSDTLSKAGFTVIQAENGDSALSMLRFAKPDAILLDVEMPGLNGFDVCIEIRKLPDYRYIPIMMVTGLEDYESINRAFLVGATDFTTKPINADLMSYRVRYMVRTSTYFQELQIAEHKVRALNDELLEKLMEIQQNADAVARFVPQNFLKVLNRKNIADIRLGDCVEKVMTVLFLDIKSFASIAEQLSPVAIFNLCNSLMSYLDPVIIKNFGFIDKYIGDALMALFNDADDAVLAALGMLNALAAFNEERCRNHLMPLNVGIGINTGSVIIGTVGYEARMDCSVISDAVNVASRVESLTRKFSIELLISEQTYDQLKYKEKYHLRSLGFTAVKGKNLPLAVYEVFNHNLPLEIKLKQGSIAVFVEALNYYEKNQFNEAFRLWSQIIADNPQDSCAIYLRQQCQAQLDIKNCK